MPRNAATRSCSTTLPVPSRSLAGDSVPQNGHTSFCLAGFQIASPPQAGHANFWIADVSGAGVDITSAEPRGARPRWAAGTAFQRAWELPSLHQVADDPPLA